MAAARPELLLVKINDAARMLAVGRAKLMELIACGEIGVVEIDANLPRICVESLKEFVARQRLA